MTAKPLTKLLIVDDDKDVLTVIKYCLENMSGTQIKYCNSGEEAIQEAMQFIPDLILLDVMMPEMDGIAAMHAIRLIPKLADIPIVFLTAKVQKDEIDQYFKLGALNIISKPFDPLTLPEVIKQCWEKYQEQKKSA